MNDYIGTRGNFLDAAAAKVGPAKQRSYELMQSQLGSKVLDVGCGHGIDTVALGHLVGSAGKVVGVDQRQDFIQIADDWARKGGVGDWVTHQVADAENLPFGHEAFDASRCERLLQHVAEPSRVVSEMTRVVKRGGWVVVMDTDWGTLSIDSPETELERVLARFRAKSHQNGHAGRQLRRLLGQQGLHDLTLEVGVRHFTDLGSAAFLLGILDVAKHAADAHVISASTAERWTTSLREADAAGRFFATISGVLAAGQKP